jgi:hypothetical protein
MPDVGCAQAMIGRGAEEAAAFGTMTTPDTAMSSPFRPVDR